jgi:hypothetical protein
MEKTRQSIEFSTTLRSDGTLTLPQEALRKFQAEGNTKVHVRLTAHRVTSELRTRSVTEEEIERISALQLEPRENVVRFLRAEGALAGRPAFRRRAKDVVG